MRKFLLKVFLFCIVLSIPLLPPFLVLIMSGENYADIDTVLNSREKILAGFAYNEGNYKYIKWKSWSEGPAREVVSIGSSRSLQWREQMFIRPFYNAGYTVTSIADFVPFLKKIDKEDYPKLLIVCLDQWMFNANWDALSASTIARQPDIRYHTLASSATLKSVYRDLISQRYEMSSVMDNADDGIKRIGLNAALRNNGLRNDGSFYYGTQISKLINADSSAEDYNYNDTFLRIKGGHSRFEYGTDVNPAAIDELKALLAFCKTNEMEVVAFLPPFADRVNAEMKRTGNYGYISKIYPAIEPFFATFGFELWDLTSLETVQSSDKETIDGFHGSEVAYQRMLIYMVEHGSAIGRYTDIHKLKSDLDNRQNAWVVYNY